MSSITDGLMGFSSDKGESESPSPSIADQLMGNVGSGTVEVPEVKSVVAENQVKRKARGFAGGFVNTITDSAVGLFRMQQSMTASRAESAAKELKWMKSNGITSGPLYDSFKSQYNMHKVMESKAKDRAGTIDSFWDEKTEGLQLKDQTFWDQVAVGAGQLPAAAASAVPGVGIPLIYGRMLNEGYETLKADGKSDADAMEGAEKYAIPATTLEFLVDRFMISKGGIQGLKGLSKTEVIKQGAANVAKLGKKMGLSGGSEGLTEVSQQAILNKIAGKPMLEGDMMNTFLVSSTIGAFGGGGFTLGSAKSQADISNKMRAAGMSDAAIQEVVDDLEIGDTAAAQTRLDQEGIDVNPEVLLAQLEGDDLSYEVAEYKVGAGRLGRLALQTTTTELEEELKTMDEDMLTSLAEEIKYEGDGTRADMEAFVLANRNRLPSFQLKAQRNLLSTIEKRTDLSQYERQVFKWLATGNISLAEVGQTTEIYTKLAQEAGYETVEAFFEEKQGEFKAPTRAEFELFQQEPGLKPEDNPFAQRAKKAATAMVAARNLPVGAGRMLAIRLLSRIESPNNLRASISFAVQRGDSIKAKDMPALIAVFENLETSNQYQDELKDYIIDILHGGKQNETWESAIRELHKEESFNQWIEADKYNPFNQYTAEWKLYSSALQRRSLRSLDYKPKMETGLSKWTSGGQTLRSGDIGEAGIVGGLQDDTLINATDAEILEAATHEGTHGIFDDVYAYLEEDIKKNPEWLRRANALAIKLYQSSGDPLHLVEQEIMSHPSRGLDELVAMYTAKMYNTPDTQAQATANEDVEGLFRELWGEDMVKSLQMSRDAMQARSVPESASGQNFVELYQEGAKTKSGVTIRGKTSFRSDGKFIVDLMAGGDVITLAHEFAHVFSPHMSEGMIDAMIEKIVRQDGINLDKSKASRDQTKIYMKNVWKTFTVDPFHTRFLNKEGKDFNYLVAMQEEIATQFETYLATRTAPTSKMMPAFKVFAERYRDYYGDIRKLPKNMQKVNHKIATLFDEMIAGETALPRVEAHKVTVDGDTMTLHLSRPKEAIRRKVLQALEKVDADVVGLKDAVIEYAKEMLEGKGQPSLLLEIERIKDNKDALRVQKLIDRTLAKRQLAVKKAYIKNIRALAGKQGLADIDPGVKTIIDNVLINIDMKPKSEKRVRKAASLRALVTQRLLDADDLGHEDLATTRAQMRELVSINNPSIYNMTMAELETLQATISDLIKYDDRRAQQHAAAMERKLTKRSDEFSSDTRKTWQWNSRGGKQTVIGSKLSSVYRRFFGGTLENPSRTVEDLHTQGKRLYQDLVKGRVKQDATDQHFTDRLAEILSGVDLKGVSSSLGPVDKTKIKMIQVTHTKVKEWDPKTMRYRVVVKRGGKPATYEMTTGQLMYLYGITQNEDGYRHVMDGGIMRPQGTGKNLGDETARFKFRSDEEMQTIFQAIPQELRDAVDNVMAMYKDEVAPLINETSRELLGVDIANILNYLPMAIEGRARGDKRVLHLSQLGNKGRRFALDQIEHASFLQSRTGGSNSLYAMDFFEMIDRNLTDVAEYVGMAEPIRTATAILQPGELGSTYEELADILGKRRADRLWSWIGTLEDPSVKQSDTDRFLGKVSAVVRRGILKLNISVSLSQVVSLNNIKNYLTEGGVRRDLLASVMGSDGTPLKAKYSRREMAGMHPTLRKRFEGVPEVGLKSEGEKANAQRRFGRHGGVAGQVASHALLLGETGIGPVKKMDAWAVSKLIETIERQAARHGWNQEEKWDKIITTLNRTQPTSDPLHTSYFIGSPSAGIKKFVFGVFQSARDNVRGELQTNWAAFRKAKHMKDDKGMRIAIQNMFRTWVSGAAMVAVIQEAVQRLTSGGDDEEENPFLLDIALRTLMNVIGIVPIAGTIIAGAIDSALGNYTGDINSPMLQQLSKMMKMANLPEDEEEMDAYMLRLIKETAGMVGSGWKNVIRQAERLFTEED